jgi:hypothetical protein
MFGDPSRMTAGPERPVIEQDNDIDGSFEGGSGGGIPQYLQDAIQYKSVEPASEVTEPVEPEFEVDAEKVMNENAQSRFRILNTALLAPGVCSLCGSAGDDGRQFVDFGKTVDFFGVVYFCTYCVIEAATLLGMAPKSNYTLALSNLQEELSTMDDRYVDAKVKLDAAMVLVRSCACSDSGIGLPATEIPEAELVEPVESDEQSNDSGVEQSEPIGGHCESSDSDERDVDELAFVEGSDDVPATSDDNSSAPAKRKPRVRKPAG